MGQIITDYTNYSSCTNNNIGYIKKNIFSSSSKDNQIQNANQKLSAFKSEVFKKTPESVLCGNSEINQFPKVPEYIKNNGDLYLGWLGDISHDPKYSKEVRDAALNKFNDLAKKNIQAENSIIGSANEQIKEAKKGQRNTIIGCTAATGAVIGLYLAQPVIASLGPLAGKTTRIAEKGNKVQNKWEFGKHKSTTKWNNQMKKRGWTPEQIDKAIKDGKKLPAENKVNKGNPATKYIHPETGKPVVRDNVTKEILQIGEKWFEY